MGTLPISDMPIPRPSSPKPKASFGYITELLYGSDFDDATLQATGRVAFSGPETDEHRPERLWR